MSEIILGVDNGYGNTKGRSTIIRSGVRKLATKPPIDTKTIEFNGDYYAVDVPKLDIQSSKTENENTFILTLAIIASELKKLGKYTADIRLGVGLPLTMFSTGKKELQDYMMRDRRITFKYEGIRYSIYIISADVYPQGYAGILNRINSFGTSTAVIDCGSWTVDILPLSEGQPDVSRCKSLQMGTITVMQDINEILRQRYGEEADEAIIRNVMKNKDYPLDKEYKDIIQDRLVTYVDDILNQLRAFKFNSKLTHFVFIGGGAVIIRNYGNIDDMSKVTIIEDININAKGYEDILNHKYGMRKAQ